LKSHAVFVVVWTPEAESLLEHEHKGIRYRNYKLDYWLRYVVQLAGEDSPVIVIQNQCDHPKDEQHFLPCAISLLDDVGYWQNIHYSAKFNRKRGQLHDALQEAIRYVRDRRGELVIGMSRLHVLRQLQKLIGDDLKSGSAKKRHRSLSFEKFQEFCVKAGGVSSELYFLEYLHNSGIVFWRPELFDGDVILDQNWMVEAIYVLFDRDRCYHAIQYCGGVFTRRFLADLVWTSEGYSESEQDHFLAMMVACGICFRLHAENRAYGTSAEYVAPDLLPEKADFKSRLLARWDEGVPVQEHAWMATFITPAYMRGILSSIGAQAGTGAIYWKYGVWLYDDRTKSCAIVQQEMDNDWQGKIVLRTQRGQSDVLLNQMTSKLEAEFDRMGAQFKRLFILNRDPVADEHRPMGIQPWPTVTADRISESEANETANRCQARSMSNIEFDLRVKDLKLIRSWFDPLLQDGLVLKLQLFWFIGCVDNAALRRQEIAVGDREMANILTALSHDCQCALLDKGSSHVRACVDNLAATFSKGPFVDVAWNENHKLHERVASKVVGLCPEALFKVETFDGKIRRNRWTYRANEAWSYVDLYFRITQYPVVRHRETAIQALQNYRDSKLQARSPAE
jgi:hypothetical protein